MTLKMGTKPLTSTDCFKNVQKCAKQQQQCYKDLGSITYNLLLKVLSLFYHYVNKDIQIILLELLLHLSQSRATL